MYNMDNPCICIYIYTGWWFQPTPLKNDGVRQLGLYEIPNIWKNKIHVPNHQPLMYVYTVCVYIYISTIYPTLSLATNQLAHGNPSCNPQFMARTEPEKKASRTSCDKSSTPSFCVTFLPLHPNRPTECCKKRSAFADSSRVGRKCLWFGLWHGNDLPRCQGTT